MHILGPAAGSCWDQKERCFNTIHLRVVFICWFIFSVWPLDCGCYPYDRLTVAPKWEQNSRQKVEVNCGPRPETTSTGSPCRRKTCCNISSAISLADRSLDRGMKCAILLKRSTPVRMVVSPLDGGSPVTKSKNTWDHGQ